MTALAAEAQVQRAARQVRAPGDPRTAQIVILSALFVFGAVTRGFILHPFSIFAAPAGAWLAASLAGRRLWTPRHPSAVISAVSTLLLFRSTEPWTYAVVAGIAVLSKHWVRVRGRHFINPTNGAILAGSLLLPGWIASGQWGHDVVIVFVIASGAFVVLSRAARWDTALAFIGGWLAFSTLRIIVFGYPWPILAHGLRSGTLWLFALYMITDPKTTPRLRAHRLTHGLLVALLAITLQQTLYLRDSFLWALLVCAPLVPMLDSRLDASVVPNKDRR